MPAKFHTVSPTVWDRAQRELSGPAKVVRYYVQTCPTRVSEGLFQLPLGIVAHDTGLTEDQVRHGLDQLDAAGMVSYDEDAEVVLDRTALKVNPLRNGMNKMSGEVKPDHRIAGALRMFEAVPDSTLKGEFVRLARQHSPDLADALVIEFGREIEPRRWPLIDADDLPDDLGQQAPSEPLRSTSRGPSREEARRGEPEERREEGGRVPPCGHCGNDLAMIVAGEVRRYGERPWCGWCEVAV